MICIPLMRLKNNKGNYVEKRKIKPFYQFTSSFVFPATKQRKPN